MWQLARRPCSIEVLASAGKSDHVARGINVRHRSLIFRVDRHLAARVRLQSGRFKRKLVAVRLAAHRVQQRIGLHFLAALEFREHAIALLVESHAGHLIAQPERRPHLPQMVGERLYDFAVHKIEQLRTLIDQRHFHAHRRHERRVFQAHDARSDNNQFARQTLVAR